MDRLVIFGVGQYYRSREQMFTNENVVAFVDNNVSIQGSCINGVEVISVEEMLALDYDYVCIMTGHSKAVAIRQQLIEAGVEPDRIGSYIDYFALESDKRIQTFGRDNPDTYDVCLFLPTLAVTGGFRAAIYAIRAMKELSKTVMVVSTCDGEGRADLLDLDVDLVLTPDISEHNSCLLSLISKARTLFFNSIYFSYFMPYVSLHHDKVIWWLHTAKLGYDNCALPDDLNVINGKVSVYGVSEIACKEFSDRVPGVEIGMLPFGIPEQLTENKSRVAADKTIFAVIGYVQYIKGIDVAIKAFNHLEPELRDSSELWIIGRTPNRAYLDELLALAGNNDHIKWLGPKKHDEVIDLLSGIDILISPSREETLSIVVLEAMINSVPCIISDAVGIAGYAKDGIDVLTFESEKDAMLTERMAWCCNNPDEAGIIGRNGCALYHREFSMEKFMGRLKEILEPKITYLDLEKAKNKDYEICIFGAGKFGRGRGYTLLKCAGYDIDYYVDNNAEAMDTLNGIPVRSPEYLYGRRDHVFVFICSKLSSDDIEEQLKEHGIYNYMVLSMYVISQIMESIDSAGSEVKSAYREIYDDAEYLKMVFLDSPGYPLDLADPRTFNEKLQWLKLYDRNPLYTELADKISFKDYVSRTIGNEYPVPILGVWDKYDDINFDELPDRFVLKCTHDCGSVVIVNDKARMDHTYAREKLNRALNINYYWLAREWPYKNCRKKIIAEEYLGDDIVDYKFLCFNGIPRVALVCADRFSGKGFTATYLDMDWNRLPFTRSFPVYEGELVKPANYELMVELSRKLAGNIPFVRVDFYEINGRVLAGEMTFFPGGGRDSFSSIEWDYKFGDMLDLSVVEAYGQ